MTRLSTLVALPILALADPAAAACATDHVSTAPVRVVTVDEEVSVFSMLPDGSVLELLTFPGDPLQSAIVTRKGLYVTALYDVQDGTEVPGSRVDYRFPVPLDDLPDVAPGGSFATVIKVDEGGIMSSQRQSYGFGPLQTVSYGGCDYEMIEVTIAQATDGYIFTETIHYFPALGIGAFVAYQDDTGLEVYEIAAIEPAG